MRRHSLSPWLVCLLSWIATAAAAPEKVRREPVHPRRTVEEFPPVPARFVRFTIHATNFGEPGLDELEIYGPEDESRNLALVNHDAHATASGSLPGYAIHQLKGVHDGRYGNGSCWIGERREGAWVQIELPRTTPIHRIVWSRDREGKFIDRLATRYVIEAAGDDGAWRTVASSEDREPLPADPTGNWLAPVTRQFAHRFVPMSASLSAETELGMSEYTIDRWQTSDGLPGNTVTAISQDPDGYLWLGTLNGLVRFDGLRFQIFGQESGLTNPRILCLLHDRQGALWIGTESGGLARRTEGRTQRWTSRDGLLSDTVLSLAEDERGRIWIGTSAGVSSWDGQQLAPGPRIQDRSSTAVSRMVPAGDTLWSVIGSRIVVSQDGEFRHAEMSAEPSRFTSMFALHRGPSGHLWFGGANNYIGCLKEDQVCIFPEQPGHLLNSVWELLETRRGDVWVGTANGGLRRLREGRFLSITTQEGLSDNSIRSLCEDREGNLWVGTVAGGLNRIKPRRLTTFTTRDGLSHNVVMSLAEDREGTLWVGSNCGGLSVGREGRFAPHQPNYLLDNECVWSLLTDREGALWIGTWGGGLFRQRGGELSHFVLSQRFDDEPVTALCEDSDGSLWVGTYQLGLLRFHQGTFHRIHWEEAIPSPPITSLVTDPAGTLWIGTEGGGLLRLSSSARAEVTSADGTTRSVRPEVLSRRDGLPSETVRTLYRDGEGMVWVGTAGGLARVGGGSLRAFTRAQGLPNDVISQILEDDRGRLWLGSQGGILRVSRDDLEAVAREGGQLNVALFGREEGMEGIECTGGFHPAGLKTRDGVLWFSTVKGLVKVDPSRLEPNRIPPPVRIEQVLVDGVELTATTGPAGARTDKDGRWLIGPGAGRIEVHFTALSLVSPERNRFRYRLEGLESAWVSSRAERVAAYTRIPAGRYRFQVQACNNDGVWNETGASL
ncbi:MAG: hypothetical protein KIT22_07940, partial [Verrucomicrobiae bacterium]|nr:hypothetical protein [Verrucomicrobiae bacterium]